MEKVNLMKICCLICSLLFFSCESSNKNDIFAEVISEVNKPFDSYEKMDSVKINKLSENDSELSEYTKYFNITDVINVSVDSNIITFWKENDTTSIQRIELSNKSKLFPISRYIGQNKKKILSDYPLKEDNHLTESAIEYTSNDWKYFLRFELDGEIVKKIILGKNL